MKMSLIIIHALITVVIILFSSCNEENFISSNNNSIQFVSFQSNGCVSSNELLKVSDEPSLNQEYLNGNLTLKLIFQTLCSASLNDSIVINNQAINIFLTDTDKSASHCVCQQEEIFKFKVESNQTLTICCYFKSYTQQDYHFLIERVIDLQ